MHTYTYTHIVYNKLYKKQKSLTLQGVMGKRRDQKRLHRIGKKETRMKRKT